MTPIENKEPPLPPSKMYQRRLMVKTDLPSKPVQITPNEVWGIDIFKWRGKNMSGKGSPMLYHSLAKL